MNKEGRINLRLDVKLVLKVKSYARRHGTTMSALIEAYLRETLEKERIAPTKVHEAEQL